MLSTVSASVSVRGLAKSYGTVAAVRGVSFELFPGEIFGLLGQNGAGKTTVIECLLGLRRPDAGSITIEGIDARAAPARAREYLGAQLQFAALQDKISVREALQLFGSFYSRLDRTAELLAQFDLTAQSNAAFDSLSGGQKQRLFLALALVNQPRVLVLDEPTAGLDPQSRRNLHHLIAGLKAEGRTVLLSTHDLTEAQALCDRIGILVEGQFVAVGTPAELMARSVTKTRISFCSVRAVDPANIAILPGVTGQSFSGGEWKLSTDNVNRTIAGLVRELEKEGNEMLDLKILRPSLEDVFIELTGRAWAGSAAEESK